MMERWQQLNEREQQLISALAAVFIIFILYSAVWQPLNENLVKTKEKIERQQTLLSWVKTGTTRYTSIKKQGGSAKGKGSLSSIANRTARINSIVIARIQPQGDDIQIWIDEAPFSQLLQWLEHLSSKEGLQVKAIDLSTSDKPGVVRVRRLQLGHG